MSFVSAVMTAADFFTPPQLVDRARYLERLTAVESVAQTLLAGQNAPDCTLARACGLYLVVEHTGDIYSCDFFVEDAWKLGNVMTGHLSEMLNSSRQVEFGNWKAATHDECKTCPWLRTCWGGCTKDRIRNPQEKGPNHFCRSYKMFFEHADARLTEMALQWRQGNRQSS
jgi:uncharacterized protein